MSKVKQNEKIILPVTGMTCASCANTIEKGLSKVPGVSGVTVNFASEKASIDFDPTEVDSQAFLSVVSDAGYGVALEKKTFGVNGMSCASCVSHVENALRELKGVISANVNLATEKATVEYLSSETGIAEFKRAVESAGYHVTGKKEDGKKKVTFAVTGMTCASCVSNVGKALRELDGIVSANVNLASEQATVEYDAGEVGMADFRKVIEGAGYGIGVGDDVEVITNESDLVMAAAWHELRILKTKLILSGVIGLFMLLVAISGLSGEWLPAFLGNHYLLWVLSTPVQFWAGWQFYRGFWTGLKHKRANMNTLIAVGTSAAYFYSVAAILAPSFFASGGREANVYFDTAAIIIALILLGRFLEAMAKGQTSEVIKKLMGMQVKTARVVRQGKELDISVESESQAKKIIEIMENSVKLKIPNKVDYESGNNWGEING